jgi:hypothetical protein
MTIIVDGMFRYVPVLVIWESMVLTLQGFKGSIHAAREYPLSWHCERRMDEGNYTRIPGISTKV